MKQLSQRPRITALRAVRPLLLMACVQPCAHAQPLPAVPIKAPITAPGAAFSPSPANPAQKSAFNTTLARTPITQLSEFQSRSDSEIITNAQGKSITMGEVKRGINANIHQAQTRIEPSEIDSQKTPVKIKRESRELAKFEQFRSALHGRVNAELLAAKGSAQALVPMVAKVPQGTALKAQPTLGSASLADPFPAAQSTPVSSPLCFARRAAYAGLQVRKAGDLIRRRERACWYAAVSRTLDKSLLKSVLTGNFRADI
jgi:hypothetical protein